MRVLIHRHWSSIALFACVLAAPVQVSAGDFPLAPGVFLVATDHLFGTRFTKAVIVLTQVDAQGAMGIVINQRSQQLLKQHLPELNDDAGATALYWGGPVHPKALFVLSRKKPGNDWVDVLADTALSGGEVAYRFLMKPSSSVLDADIRAYAGYTGWAPGQLRAEIERGDWRTFPGDQSSIFSTKPGEIWESLSKLSTGNWM